jgi:hypothetical protein
MIWIAAWGIITPMADVQTVTERPMFQEVNDSMGGVVFPVKSNNSIPA